MPRLFTIATILAAIALIAGISAQTVDASPQNTDAASVEDGKPFGEVADIEDADPDIDSGFESSDTDAPVEETPYRLPAESSLPEAAESDVNELIHHPESSDYDEHDIVRGDFDRDGTLDLTKDLRMLRVQIDSDKPDLLYDLDGDGVVTESDIAFWIERIRGRLIGDFNLDNRVDSSDLVDAHKFAKFKTGEEADWSMGDANGDRVFDSLDEKLIQMSGNYEATPSPRRSAASAVPEPILLSLVGMGLVFLLLAYTALQGQRQQNRAAKN